MAWYDPQVEPTAPDPDLSAFDRLDAVRAVLRVMLRTTGLRVALVAGIADGDWTASAVLDEAGFGLKPGDVRELSNTY